MQRFSINRQAILDCLRGTTSHPTAEWIYQQLKPDHPNLSLGTVYRNLQQLVEAGLIRSVGVIAGEAHFDADMSAHVHVMCMNCGRILDLDGAEAFSDPIRRAEQITGFHALTPQFDGLCPECAQRAVTVNNQEENILNHEGGNDL